MSLSASLRRQICVCLFSEVHWHFKDIYQNMSKSDSKKRSREEAPPHVPAPKDYYTSTRQHYGNSLFTE
jgi:hypothetical protein